MSLLIIYVNSLDVSDEVESRSTVIRKTLTSHASTTTFVLNDPATAPVEGNDVKIYLDSEILFGGVIESIAFTYLAPGGIKKYVCSCSDYRRLLNRRLVPETYLSGVTVTSIILDIINKYTSGFTTTNVFTGGSPPHIYADMTFNYRTVCDAIQEVLDTWCAGSEFYVDESKDLHVFFTEYGLTSPYHITDDTLQSIFDKFNISCDYSQVRNSVLIEGGYKLSDTSASFSVKADGAARQWTLPYYPHEMTVKVGGGDDVTLGEENVDPDDGTHAYFYNYYEKLLKCATATTTPTVGTVITCTMKYEIPLLVRKDNVLSQSRIAAAEGGDGKYEYSVKDTSIETKELCTYRATAELLKNSWPVIRGSAQTYSVIGFKAGQRIKVDITGFQYNGTYIIDDLEIESQGNNILLWTVNFRGWLT